MAETEILRFQPWPDPAVDPMAQEPSGDFSRLAWLPVIGPSSWLVWGTLAAQLRREPEITWTVRDLAWAHGLHGTTARNGLIRRTLARLCQFRLLALLADDEDRFLVRMTAPPLSRGQLVRSAPFVVELQRQIFQVPRTWAG
jgi:hypothetical protein